jgi:hypothetical protein
MWATAGIAITVHSNDAANCVFNPDFIETYGDDYSSSWGTQVIKKNGDTKKETFFANNNNEIFLV